DAFYVAPSARKLGIGKALIKQAETWAIKNGCTQLASDVLIENTESCQFHTQVGFAEVERVVCFIKNVETP
ncbi:MAG: GNAT family N-acetyltransferase, partial [Cyanobacteria bacterium J06576_12]